MQFLPIPIVTVVRPSMPHLSIAQSTSVSKVVMSFALAADFKKYAFACVLNDLTTSQKDQKKSQNAQTCISTLSFEEIIHGKTEAKLLEDDEKNRKTQDSFKNQSNNEEKLSPVLPRKRQCYQRARCQITQAFEQSEESKCRSQVESSKKEEEQISYRNKIEIRVEQVKESVLRKQKKIKKCRKVQKPVVAIEPVQKTYISTSVSLIDTIDHPRITIDRFQIQQKRQNLLSRVVVYEEVQQRKCNYQIRERRELKRLN